MSLPYLISSSGISGFAFKLAFVDKRQRLSYKMVDVPVVVET